MARESLGQYRTLTYRNSTAHRYTRGKRLLVPQEAEVYNRHVYWKARHSKEEERMITRE